MKLIYIILIIITLAVFGVGVYVIVSREQKEAMKINENVCAKLETPEARGSCYIDLALLKNDISTCKRVETASLTKSCYELILQQQTASWQIYRNEEYKYEFKYPQKWIAKTKGLVITLLYPEYIPRLWISVSSDAAQDKINELKLQINNQSLAKLTSEQNIMISDVMGKQLIIYWPEAGAKDSVYNFVSYKNFTYEIDWISINEEEYQKTFNQILSTFRFLE